MSSPRCHPKHPGRCDTLQEPPRTHPPAAFFLPVLSISSPCPVSPRTGARAAPITVRRAYRLLLSAGTLVSDFHPGFVVEYQRVRSMRDTRGVPVRTDTFLFRAMSSPSTRRRTTHGPPSSKTSRNHPPRPLGTPATRRSSCAASTDTALNLRTRCLAPPDRRSWEQGAVEQARTRLRRRGRDADDQGWRRAPSRRRVLRNRRRAGARGARDYRGLREVRHTQPHSPNRPQSPDRRARRHRGLEDTVVQAREGPSRRSQRIAAWNRRRSSPSIPPPAPPQPGGPATIRDPLPLGR